MPCRKAFFVVAFLVACVASDCTDNVSWDINGENLIFSGTGAICDSKGWNTPWYNRRLEVEHITVEAGITRIGDMAFRNFTRLKSVSIADTVTSIGEDAFWNCSSLESLSIPNSVTKIGHWAFEEVGFTKLVIPRNVEYIGAGICEDQFNLESIEVEEGNNHYKSVDGVLFTKDGTRLVQYPCGKGTTYVVPDHTRTIGSHSFCGCSTLEKLTFNTDLEVIEDLAFRALDGLKTVTLPEGLEFISNDSFQSCCGLESFFYQGSKPFPDLRFICNNSLGVFCTSSEYSCPTFGEMPVNDNSICQEFQGNFSFCNKAFYDGEKFVQQKKKETIDWERNSNECVKYECDEDLGYISRGICGTDRVCVNDSCVSMDGKTGVEITFSNETDVLRMNESEFLQFICVELDIEIADLVVGYGFDDDGVANRLLVFVDDEKTADSIATTLKDLCEINQ